MKTITMVILLLGVLNGVGIGDGQKGCADKVYPAICQNGNFEGLVSEHVCFCNSFLCNSSSLPSIFLPLLVLSYLLLKLM
ncbi:hypothetical protein Hamer_G005419 [Homarus americanus]|uniref:Uncharacterized protein n=1 Tax=Homarus americanus TaxID=6706 RepID=A0A8J5K0G6_HOMAM|nr:hypothetical protein Hamer_G005419 [Homarus americanus]